MTDKARTISEEFRRSGSESNHLARAVASELLAGTQPVPYAMTEQTEQQPTDSPLPEDDRLSALEARVSELDGAVEYIAEWEPEEQAEPVRAEDPEYLRTTITNDPEYRPARTSGSAWTLSGNERRDSYMRQQFGKPLDEAA